MSHSDGSHPPSQRLLGGGHSIGPCAPQSRSHNMISLAVSLSLITRKDESHPIQDSAETFSKIPERLLTLIILFVVFLMVRQEHIYVGGPFFIYSYDV